MYPVRLTLAALLAIPVTYALLQSAHLARAEHLARPDTVAALDAALELQPGNAEYHARIASLDPSRQDQLQTALALNPRNPSWWIMQSIRQEEDGDSAAAEASLLQANSVCRYYTPRWSLASFYYRQRNVPEFTRWARASLSVGYGDSESLFRMAQKVGLSSEAMLRDLVPDDPEKVAAYLNLMMNDGETDRLYEPASRLVDLNYKPVLGMVLGNTETLFLKGRTSQALALWNKAISARWIDLAKLEPAAGKSLTHKDFHGERTGVGFDWHYSGVDGVSVSTAESDGSLRLEFSGKEPQNCDLASQLVPLLPGRKYRLAVKYWSDSIPAGSGLQWGIYPANGGPALVTLPLNSPPGAPAELSAYLDTPAAAMPLKLQLSYARAPGTTRAEGVLNVQSVDLVLIP